MADPSEPDDQDASEAHDASEAQDSGTKRRGPVSHAIVPDEPPRTALPPKVEAWRKRSATGAILTGFAFGLREVLEAPRDEPSITMETSGEPPSDLPVEAHVEHIRPRHSVVSIRPWLLGDPAPPVPPPAAGAGAEQRDPDGIGADEEPGAHSLTAGDPALGRPEDN